MADVLSTDLLVFSEPRAASYERHDLQVREDAEQRAKDGAALRDLAVCRGVDNLRQALIARLLTPQRSYAALGHPEYGSRLHELLGEPLTATTLARARTFVLQAFQAESRVQRVERLEVDTIPGRRHLVEIHALLVVGGAGQPEMVEFATVYSLSGSGPE